MKSESSSFRALRACFSSTIPVLAGYVFLGITYGILMRTNGFPAWLPVFTAAVIYTGSMEFLMVDILASSFHPLSAMATALMVGARHLFYGIAMLKKYRSCGKKKLYLIYATSDETFAVNYAAVIPEGVDAGWYYFWVSLLDQLYWVIGSAIGSLFGGMIAFSTEGLDFVMTAMFIVIFMSQWMKDGTAGKSMFADHVPELIGLLGSALCLVLFGPDRFIIPSMIVILVSLLALRRPIEKRIDEKGGNA